MSSNFGEKLKALRAQVGLSQKALAKMAGLSQATISQMENGERGFTSVTFLQISEALGVDGSALLGELPVPERTSRPIPWVQAGGWAEAVDSFPVGCGEDYVQSLKKVSPQAFALRVVGDSMEPRYFEGDVIIVDPEISCDNGCPCVTWLNGETTFKIFRDKGEEIHLEPLNDRHETKVIKKAGKADFRVIGKVVEMIPKL